MSHRGGDVVPNAYIIYGNGISAVWLDNVECHGDEASLDDCPKLQSFGQHNCDGSTDVAGVKCFGAGNTGH